MPVDVESELHRLGDGWRCVIPPVSADEAIARAGQRSSVERRAVEASPRRWQTAAAALLVAASVGGLAVLATTRDRAPADGEVSRLEVAGTNGPARASTSAPADRQTPVAPPVQSAARNPDPANPATEPVGGHERRTVEATVVAGSAGDGTVRIDRGFADGLRPGLLILAAPATSAEVPASSGAVPELLEVVGTIVEVGEHSATVDLAGRPAPAAAAQVIVALGAECGPPGSLPPADPTGGLEWIEVERADGRVVVVDASPVRYRDILVGTCIAID